MAITTFFQTSTCDATGVSNTVTRMATHIGPALSKVHRKVDKSKCVISSCRDCLAPNWPVAASIALASCTS